MKPMSWQFNLLTLPIIISALIAISLTIYAWRFRTAGLWVNSFVLLALALATWSIGYVMELTVLELPAKIAWIKFEYLGIVTTPVAWFLFAIQYSGRKRWEGRNYIAAMFIVPAVTLLLVFTNEAHNLIWKHYSIVESGPLPFVDVEYGFWFWIHSAYSYVLMLSGTIILLRRLRRFPAFHVWQIWILMLAPIVPLISNGIYLFELGPVPQLDMSPIAFALSGIIFAWGIFSLHLFDFGPVARRTVVDNMSDGMIVLNLQNQIMDANPAAKTILGTEMDNMMGRSIDQFLTNGPDIIGQFDKLSQNNGEIVLDIQEQDQWFEIHISPIHDARARVRGRVIVMRNITERKRSEAFLAQRNQILQTLNTLSQEMSSSLELQTLLNTAAKSATQALDATSAYINDWNKERGTTTVLAEYFAPDASSSERISHLGETYKLEADFGPLSDSELNSFDKYVTHMDDEDISEKFRTHMEHHGVKTLLEIPLYAKAKLIGTLEVWESRNKRVFSDEELGLVFEISRQIAVAMDNAFLYENALAVNRLKSTILARVSHELRTPLSIILLYAEMLQYSDQFKTLPQESQEAVEKIIYSADDLAYLIDELLDQSKINSATLALHIDAYMPARLLEKVSSQMEFAAGQKGVTYRAEIEPEVPEFVTGDENRVKQILVNLVGNAIKFTEEGTVEVVFCRHDEEHWAMRVSDTGAGISKEEQAFIFEPFRQGAFAENETRAGIGLGLSIVEQLVDLMDGRVNIESEVGQGSIFTVILPLEQPAT